MEVRNALPCHGRRAAVGGEKARGKMALYAISCHARARAVARGVRVKFVPAPARRASAW